MQSERSSPLVFVIGAGASKDFGESMPVGFELAARIEATLNSEFQISDSVPRGPIRTALLKSKFGQSSDALAAANQIRRSLFAQPSIDDLLNEWRERPDMIRVGKMAIAYEILKAEKESSLSPTQGDDPEEAFRAVTGLRKSWLTYLIKHLSAGVNRRDVATIFKDVAFVVFNYDRCIEQYLYWAFQSVGGLNPGNAAIELAKIPIVHVYGHLGQLPFSKSNPHDVGFGSEFLLSERIANRIKTYTEEDHDQANLSAIHKLILAAKRLVFLGFGYHERNVELLFSKGVPSNCRVWGTAGDTDQTRLLAVQSRIFGINQPSRARLEPAPCASLLSMFRGEILG